jgi:replicative DNA helicase
MLPINDPMLERSVLISTAYIPESCESVMDRARIEWFSDPDNVEIFKACKRCRNATGKIDPISLVSDLKNRGHIKAAQSITAESQYASPFSAIDHHMDTLEELAIKRTVFTAAMEASRKATDPETDAFECLDELARSVTKIQDSDTKIHSHTASEVIQAWESQPKMLPFTIGDPELDNGIYNAAGRQPGQIEVTLAHSGHGKTRYAIYKTMMLAMNGIKTHWFQLEDYGYNTALMFQKTLPAEFVDNIIITDSIFEIELIKREARISAREFGVQNIVVDYVQNLSADKKSRAEDVEYISRQLTRMAIDLKCQVQLMSQLTIHDSQRKKWNLEPRDSDVRWSRQLQQDAHLITGVFRPERIDGLYDEQCSYDWGGNLIPKNSVFIKQLKSRYGQPYTKRYHMIDTEHGFVDAQKWVEATESKNNAWRTQSAPKLHTPSETNAPF